MLSGRRKALLHFILSQPDPELYQVMRGFRQRPIALVKRREDSEAKRVLKSHLRA
jgi:hypothetical protein